MSKDGVAFILEISKLGEANIGACERVVSHGKDDIGELAAKAADAAGLLKAVSNEHRLLVLCHLISAGELSAGDLVSRIGLSQSAVSQHLARLRANHLIAYRREGQTLFYHVVDPRAEQLLQLLRDLFCPELGNVTDDRGATG